MLYEPAGYERNYFRRRAPSEEEREDPDLETTAWSLSR